MYTKKTLMNSLLMGTISVSALEMIEGETYDSDMALSSNSAGYGCHICLRNGWVYAVPDAQSWYSVLGSSTDYSGECCDSIENCPNAYDSGGTDSLASGWKASSVSFNSVDMAVHACPMKESKCWTSSCDTYNKATQACNYDGDQGEMDWDVNGYGLGMRKSALWTTQDSCSYLMGGPTYNSYTETARSEYFIKSQLPILKYRTDATENVESVLVHYLEWESAQVTYDSVYTAWPDTQSSVSVVDRLQYNWTKNNYPQLSDGTNT